MINFSRRRWDYSFNKKFIYHLYGHN